MRCHAENYNLFNLHVVLHEFLLFLHLYFIILIINVPDVWGKSWSSSVSYLK